MAYQRNGANLMQKIGVALVNPTTGTIEQEWDVMPAAITHAGENRTGAIVGSEFVGGRLLANRVTADPPTGDCPVLSSASAWDGTAVVVTRTYGPPDLARHKAEAKARISADAEAARSRYITLGFGKVMSYLQVAQEAIRYGATGGAGTYPFLQARVDSGRYASLAVAATSTQAIEAQWAAIGSSIDQVEDRAKIAVDASSSLSQISAAIQVAWP